MKSVPEYLPIPNPARLTGLRPQLNRLLSDVLADRWIAGARGTAPDPCRFFFEELLGIRRIAHGYALNLRYVYYGRQAAPYIVEGCTWGYDDGPLTGESWARSCSCPDFQKRHGADRDKLRGEARCCKHMILFMLLARTWSGRLPWMGVFTPAEFVYPGEAPQLREFGEPVQSQAVPVLQVAA